MNVMKLMMAIMPGSISCKELDDKLDEYVEGELSPWNRVRFAMHFLMCKACAVYAAGYSKTIALLKDSIDGANHPTADEEVPEELVQDILNKQAAANSDI